MLSWAADFRAIIADPKPMCQRPAQLALNAVGRYAGNFDRPLSSLGNSGVWKSGTRSNLPRAALGVAGQPAR
jgi:hypothetical protein